MKKLLYIILLLPFIVNAQQYTQGIQAGAPFIRIAPSDKYPTGYSVLLNGGRHSYATLAGRDSLNSYYPQLLRDGMEVFVRATNLTYRWNNSTTAWVIVSYGDVTKAYVDSSNNTKLKKTTDTFSGTLSLTTTGLDKNGLRWEANSDAAVMYLRSTSNDSTQFVVEIGDDNPTSTTGRADAFVVRKNREGAGGGGSNYDMFTTSPQELTYNPIGNTKYNIWHSGNLPLGTTGQSIRVNSAGTAFEAYTPAAGNSGTVTSITPGYGFTSTAPITTSGTLVIDTTTSIRTVNNSLSTAQIQSRFNTLSTVYQPLENQRLSTTNSPTFVTQSLTNGYGNFVNATTIPTPVTGQTNFGFISGSITWRNPLGQRRIRSGITGDVDYYLPSYNALTIQKLANADSVNTALALKQNILPIFSNGALLQGNGTNIPVTIPQLFYEVTSQRLRLGTANGTNVDAKFSIRDSLSTLTNPIQTVYNLSIKRMELLANGTQRWILNNGASEAGTIGSSTPFSMPGFVFTDASGASRSDIRMVANGGFDMGFVASSAIPTTSIFFRDGKIGIGQTPVTSSIFSIKAGTATQAQISLLPSPVPTVNINGGIQYSTDGKYYAGHDNIIDRFAYASEIAPLRVSIEVSASLTMSLNRDYANKTATQYTLTLPSTTGFATDGSKIITALAVGSGGLKILVPSGYALQSGSTFATTTGTGGATLTQGTKVQLIPMGTNSFYLQALNGTITLY